MCPHCKRPGVELLPDPETLTSQRSEMGSVAKETQAEKSVKAEERRAPAAADLGRVRSSSTVLDGAICIAFLLLFGLLYCRFG